MKNSNYSKAKLLTLIPVIVPAIAVLCMVLASILEASTNRGTLYSIFAFTGLMIVFISPLPCMVISIIGTVFAAKAARQGSAEAKKFLVLGIIEILIYVIGAILAILMFTVGQGV